MKRIALILLTALVISGCTENGPSGPNVDDFDREAILNNWADNIIIPSFSNLAESSSTLQTDAEFFVENPTPQTLQELRNSWKTTYLEFQKVSMFQIGKAMEVRYRDNMNIYPTDTTEIKENVQTGDYNLTLPSLNNSQGFPALDFLLNGLGDNDTEILTYYTTNTNADGYRAYLTDLTSRIDSLTNEVLADWTSGYRDEFVSNSGNGANSSLDMMVNDYIFYYEKHLRAGKIGIPAGVFSGSTLKGHVEAYYSDPFSKELFITALNATQDFFNGKHFDSSDSGESLHSYLNYLKTMREGMDLTVAINNQFNAARDEAEVLDASLARQVESDNSKMLATYDKLQINVVYLKVDMLQALNINVDYTDADGD
jgi:hypothetical protein